MRAHKKLHGQVFDSSLPPAGSLKAICGHFDNKIQVDKLHTLKGVKKGSTRSRSMRNGVTPVSATRGLGVRRG